MEQDVLEIGDDAIDQYVCKSDTGVHNAAADEAFGVDEVGDWEVEPISGNVDHATLLPHPTTTARVITPTQDGSVRPTRVRTPVSRLIPRFKGKSYGTTMAQIGAQMVGMTTTESIQHMEKELESMGVGNGDMAVMGVIMTNMSIKHQAVDHEAWDQANYEVEQGGNEADSHA